MLRKGLEYAMAVTPQFQILTLGLDKKSEDFVASCFSSGGHVVKIESNAQFESQFEHWTDDLYAGIFCGSNIPELSGNELGQVLQNQCPKTNKYFVTYDRSLYQPSVLLKNGFTNAFCLPLDGEYLVRTIKEDILRSVTGQKSLRPIRVFDLKPNDKLDFITFVFLPLNNRFVPFSNAESLIDESRIEKLSKHRVATLFIDNTDLDKFFKYSASKLREASKSKMGTTERQVKLESHVRGLFNSIFDQSIKTDFAGGKEMIENCQKIISNYITNGSSNDWYAHLLASVGESGDVYNHASRVSTFASMFAVALDHPHPEDLAMAGMFHDIGLVDVPEEISDKAEREWTPQEKLTYQAHPEKTLSYLKQKRISLPAEVEKAILQHHEKITGTGFPKGYSDRITVDAQILSYSDQFDYLTQTKPGKRSLSLREAHLEIIKTQSIGIDVLTSIGKLFKD